MAYTANQILRGTLGGLTLAALTLLVTATPVVAQPPNTITCATDVTNLIAAVTGDSGNGSNATRQLMFVDASTGQSTNVTTTSVQPNHLAYNYDKQIFYYISHTGQALWGYDLTTGVHTLIDGDIRTLPGNGDAPNGFTGHDAGAYWNGRFYFIPHNGTTGQTSNVLHWIEFGPTGLTITNSGLLAMTLPGGFSHMGDFGDIAIDASGIMWGSSTSQAGNQMNGLFRANLALATPVVTVLNATYAGAQLALSGNGELYGNSWQTGQVNRLNKTTGAIISTVAIGFGGDFYDEASLSRPACDWGDLPDPPYATLLASNGPSHKTQVNSNVHLGATVDSEPNGQPAADASGDGADEDGVTFLSPVIAGRVADIQVNSSGAGRLNAWIDFNSDGDFNDAGEQIATNLVVAAGNTLLNNVPVPAGATGVMAARFRLTTGLNQGGSTPTGPASTGEVEDYRLACIGDHVWNDLDGDGINEPLGNDGLPGGGDDEPGVSGVTVRLVRPVSPYSQIPDGNGVPISTTTDVNGDYRFCGLPPTGSSGLPNPGNYRILFDRPGSFQDFSPPDQGGNDLIDSDADQDTFGTGLEGLAPLPAQAAITLAAAQTNNSVDAGLRAVTVALITSADAYAENGGVVFEFSTGYEMLTAGFDVLRWDDAVGGYVAVNEQLVPALAGAPQGGVYRVADRDAPAADRLTYVIAEHQTDGRTQIYGPFRVAVRRQRGETPLTGAYAAQRNVSSRLAERVAAGHNERLSAQPSLVAGPRFGAGGHGGAQNLTLELDVRDRGLYYVSAAEIAATAGISESRVRFFIGQGQVAIDNLGQPVAWLPADHSNGGLFFYGDSIDSVFTLDNPYRIHLDQFGERMELVKGGFPLADESGTFHSREHFERDLRAALNSTFEDGVDFWYWDGINAAGPDRIRTFDVAVPDPMAGSATLTTYLVGAINGAAAVDHHVTVRVNGVEVGTTEWGGLEHHAASMTFDGSLLTPMTTIEVEGSLEGGATVSGFFIDGFDLDYVRPYHAVEDGLRVNGDGNAVVTVDGFTSADILAFDVTDPRTPRLKHGVRVEYADGGFRASFLPDGAATPYFVTTATAAQSGHDLRRIAPQINLRDAGNAYEHVVIAPAAWHDAAARLAAYHTSTGMPSLAVDLENVYDAFADGLATPWAIRDFLAYARDHWSLAPTYVVLAGRGTYDPRDRLGFGNNFITPVMVSTSFGLIASDAVLADLENEDSIPEVSIGRLPIVSAAELDAYVDKLEASAASFGDWRGRALLLAGNVNPAGNFPEQSDDLGALLAGYASQKVYLSQMSVPDGHAALTAAWNDGVQLVNYIGHGGVQVFNSIGFLSAGQMDQLTNGDRQPIVSALTCVVGRSEMPDYESLAEALVTDADGGAIAVFAPSGLSSSGAAHGLGLYYAAVLAIAEPDTPLGRVVLDALGAWGSNGAPIEMLQAYGITGDPAVRLP